MQHFPAVFGLAVSMRYFFACIALLVFCSCSIERRIYSPTQINNPALQKKNDHCFSATYGGPSGFDFNGGYALSNRLAIIGGAYSYRNNDHQTESTLFFNSNVTDAQLLYRHRGFHGGLGLYFPLSKKEPSAYLSFFTGYIKGKFRMDEHNIQSDPRDTMIRVNDYLYKSDIGRYFFQGGFNAHTNHFAVSLTARYNYVTYSNVTTNYPPDDQHFSFLPPLGYSKNSQFIDYGFDATYFFSGNHGLGIMVFANGTSRLNKKEFNFNYYGYRVGFGIVAKNPFSKK